MSILGLAVSGLRSGGEKLIYKLLPALGAFLLGRLVRPVLEQAHNCYLDRCRWQRRWEELTESVDVKVVLASMTNRDTVPTGSIYIRNTSESPIYEFSMGVEAKSGRHSYPQSVTIPYLEPGRIYRQLLTDIPEQGLFTTEKGIFSTYDAIEIYPRTLTQDGMELTFLPRGVSSHPTHFDILNGEWVRWQGKLYNTSAIKEEVSEARLRWMAAPSHRYGIWGLDAVTQVRSALRAKLYLPIPFILLLGILASGPIQRIWVWSLLLSRCRRLTFDIDDVTKDAAEYVLRRGQGARPISKTPDVANRPTETRDDV